jgi:ribosomal protein L37AE/L43A
MEVNVMRVICPNCGSKDVGKIGTNQYYCWNCFIEMSVAGDQISSVYQVEEDGSLHSLNDLFFEEQSIEAQLNM